MRTIYIADPTVRNGKLGIRIREEVDAGRLVLMQSVSGAAMMIANVRATGTVETVAVRHCAAHQFDTDGIPLLI